MRSVHLRFILITKSPMATMLHTIKHSQNRLFIFQLALNSIVSFCGGLLAVILLSKLATKFNKTDQID